LSRLKKGKVLNETSGIYIFLVVIAVGFVPLLVRAAYIFQDDKEKALWYYTDYIIDYFNYYKSKVLLITVALILAIFIFELIRNKTKIIWDGITALLTSFLIINVLATLFSVDVETSVNGHISRFEGLYVYTAYILLALLIINILQKTNDIERILNYMLVFGFIIGIIGILQVYGISLLNMDFFKKIIVPARFHNNLSAASIEFNTKGMYTTLYNPNFVGSYAVLLLPVSICVFFNKKNKHAKYFFYIVSMLIFAMLIGSKSRAGYLGFIVASVFLFIMNFKYIKKIYKELLIILAGFIIVFIIMNLTQGSAYIKEAGRLNPISEISNEVLENDIKIKSIFLNKNTVNIKTSETEFSIEVLETGLNLYDRNTNLLNISKKENQYFVEDNEYSFLSFEIIEEKNLLKTGIGQKVVYFSYNNLEFKMIGGNGIEVSEIKEPMIEHRLPINDNFASHRGYIWRRALPLIYKKPVLGYGLDTFIYVFPQHDYIGKLNNVGYVNRLVSKPHNLYLQIAVSSGIPALLVFLTIIFFVFKDSIKLIKKERLYSDNILLKGLIASILGYLVAGLFNDSIVCVAPVFWGSLGMTVRLLKKGTKIKK
jgi:hypothetical protein